MPEKGPVGSVVIAIAPQTLPWAVTEVRRALGAEQVASLKVPSGEHLAAILTTTFLACVPTSVDLEGGTDLTFDLSRRPPDREAAVELGTAGAADFEVKSLPGNWRKFNAEIDKALAAGGSTDNLEYRAKFRCANEVLQAEGRAMIGRAKNQLDQKSRPGHSKNVFLIAHVLDHPFVEYESPVIAHLLDPLSDLDGIDSVWLLWAPSHLVVWSAVSQTWANLIFNADQIGVDYQQDMEFLQQVEQQFLEEIGHQEGSPYIFGLTAG
jgi:hypothetical protein